MGRGIDAAVVLDMKDEQSIGAVKRRALRDYVCTMVYVSAELLIPHGKRRHVPCVHYWHSGKRDTEHWAL